MSKIILIISVVLCFFSCANRTTSHVSEKINKPNIVFIFTDDQTYTSVNALGNKEIITPNLNRLVAEGTTFTHAYNMGSWSGAVCAASRAMMISGRSVWKLF